MQSQNQLSRSDIFNNLYTLVSDSDRSLVDITWKQHVFHEKRRWSAIEKIVQIDFKRLSNLDEAHIWNAGKAELTTKPGADRLAKLADSECRRWQETNPALAAVMQSCGTWSRYWNEEESFHEATLTHLSRLINLEPIENDTFIEFRQIFPDDDMLRTLFLLAISEITAAVNYSYCSQVARDAGLKNLFKQISADETQHMSYFLSFAKALIDSGEYSPKGVFAVAHLFVRDGGELYGSSRSQIEQRNSHVNWWDSLEYNIDKIPNNIERKKKRIFLALKQVTGIEIKSADEVEEQWLELVGC